MVESPFTSMVGYLQSPDEQCQSGDVAGTCPGYHFVYPNRYNTERKKLLRDLCGVDVRPFTRQAPFKVIGHAKGL